MKGRCFFRRVQFATSGFVYALKQEASFRTQVIAAIAVIGVAIVLRPPLVWTALLALCIGLVLGAELFNTALEAVLDGLHPERAEFVRIAKDCAAAAVLVFSIISVAVFICMLSAVFGVLS